MLGYQLLGINKLDEAVTPLKNASLDMKNQQAATILLNLLAKIKANDLKSETPQVPQQEEPQQVQPEKIVPEENPLPEKVEPNKALMNQPDTIKLDNENMVFIDSNAQPIQAANTEEENIETIQEAGPQNSANEQSHQKAKEGILLATLFVIAGSTGLGHFMHH